jgi:DNA-binding transcriptional regulator YiaG
MTVMFTSTAERLGSNQNVLAAFACRLKELRTRIFVKQISLSYEIRCTEAAISYWESGQRLPQHATLHRILAAFARHGANHAELNDLMEAWRRGIVHREMASTTRPSPARTVLSEVEPSSERHAG